MNTPKNCVVFIPLVKYALGILFELFPNTYRVQVLFKMEMFRMIWDSPIVTIQQKNITGSHVEILV